MKNTNITLKKSERNSSIELLRILAMFSIVICHFATHGKFKFPIQSITLPRLWWNFIEMGGNFGVDVFVLISGYFLINSKTLALNFKKLMIFWGQIFFYSILILVVSYVLEPNLLNVKDVIKAVFPITFSVWWFASTYFVLFLIHPYINKLLYALDIKQYNRLVIMLTVCWCIIPTFTNTNFQSNQLFEFIYLYIIAGYIRIYENNIKLKTQHCFALFGLFTLITYLSCVFFIYAGTKFEFLSSLSLYFYGRNKLPTLLRAIFIFIAFIKIKPFNNKIINKISSATFGVYLLHDNPILRKYLWIDLFQNATFQNSNWIILYSIGVCLLIFVICVIIDLIRQKSVEKIYIKYLTSNQEKIVKPILSIYNSIEKFIFGGK